ncbi:F-box protein At4g00755 isoform X4 [Cryptomeria japonica]|uniref:F-box protein At4g00755 isoform X4 n=2 Tax=Cryptomeria japonica TaxID=3369 RepID=UPI0025AD4AF3|nr:F-box protein At4g00755 isoform X4 [Cryptomeria japonica]
MSWMEFTCLEVLQGKMDLVIENLPLENGNDLLQQIGADNARSVLQYLETPADLARISAVSRFWRHFVAENQCSRGLCIKLFPEVSRFVCAFEIGQQVNFEGASLSKVTEWKNIEREHRVYTQLARDLMEPATENNCIQHPISASSTDIFPDESIMYTLHPSAIEDDRPSYWSSQGESNSDVPETLTYRLSSRLCVVHEVKIHPFQAYFQMGLPIYSAKAVRIRLGRTRSSTLLTSGMLDGMMSADRSASEDYVWTYISPEFPMQQEDKLQTFRLPKPVLCIGGILQIELLGRVQRQEMDGLYYICVCHARVVGRPLPAAYDFEALDQEEKYILKYSDRLECCGSLSEDLSRGSSEEYEAGGSSGWLSLSERIRRIRAGRVLLWNQSILKALLGNIVAAILMIPDDEDSDGDDDILRD